MTIPKPNTMKTLPKEEIHDLYFNKNMTIMDIKSIYKCHCRVIYRLFKDNGWKMRKGGYSKKVISISKEDITNLFFDNNKTITEIASHFDVSHGSIEKLFKQYNIDAKSKYRRIFSSPEQNDIFTKYTVDKIGIKELAMIYHTDDNKIKNILNNFEVDIRKRGDFWNGVGSLCDIHKNGKEKDKKELFDKISKSKQKYKIEEVEKKCLDFQYLLLSRSIYRQCVDMKCLKDDIVWKCNVSQFMKYGVGCPCCKFKNETLTYKLLIDESWKIDKNKYLCDYYWQGNIHKIYVDFILKYKDSIFVIEYNGKQHYEIVDFGGGNDAATLCFERQTVRDTCLRQYCSDNKIGLYEIDGRQYNIEMNTLTKIVEDIKNNIKDIK